mmetsp:Transcript_19253/g.65040  ORF Transcript_19253/g.65040 Transcript_19253/m.65040 type:complete len:172 (-) Transcript_19253:181-696(-)
MFASLRPARRALSAVAAPARRTRRPLPSPLTVTGNAVERVRALISKKPDALGVVLGVRKRGCNGLSYTLNYAETQPDAKCEIVNLEGDLKARTTHTQDPSQKQRHSPLPIDGARLEAFDRAAASSTARPRRRPVARAALLSTASATRFGMASLGFCDAGRALSHRGHGDGL